MIMTSALVIERRVVLPSLLLATAIPSIIVAAAAGFGTRFARLVIGVVAIFGLVAASLHSVYAVAGADLAAAEGGGVAGAAFGSGAIACFGSWCCHCFCYAAAIIDYCLIDLIIVVCIWSLLERLAMLEMVCTVVAKERGNRLQYAICGVGQIYLDSDKAMSISMVDGVDS